MKATKKQIREWSRFGWAHYKHRVMEFLGETDFNKQLPQEYIDAFPHGRPDTSPTNRR